MTQHEETPEEHEHEHHIVSPMIYVIIGAALLVLTGTTVWASYQEWGVFNPIAALGIAVLKAVLVVLFFMHVKYTSEKLTKIVIVSAIFWLFLLLALSMADYGTRLLS